MNLDRRVFLKGVVAGNLTSQQRVPRSRRSSVTPLNDGGYLEIIDIQEFYDDTVGFSVEYNSLECTAYPEPDGSWFLSISVWEKIIVPGTQSMRPLCATEALRKKLADVGLCTELDSDCTYPGLSGQLPGHVTPDDLLSRLKNVAFDRDDFTYPKDHPASFS